MARKILPILALPIWVLMLGYLLVLIVTPAETAPKAVNLPAPTVTITPAMALPLCEYEDGSGQMLCQWDASEQGNGYGHDVIAGDCSIDTVGSAIASAECIALWEQPAKHTDLGNGASSDRSAGPELVAECMDIEWVAYEAEMNGDSSVREELNSDGWNLTECFKAMNVE